MKNQNPMLVERLATSSVELTRDSKGQPKWVIKLYCDGNSKRELAETAKLAKTLDAWMRDHFSIEPHRVG